MDDYENDGRDYREIIDEGPIDELPNGPETEFLWNTKPVPDKSCPPKKPENPCPEQKKVKKIKKQKGRACDCKPSKEKKRRSKKKKTPISVNPFIIYYLCMLFENPSRKVTEVAREAGKKWCSLSDKEKADYIKRARAESAKRQKKSKKRRGKC